MAIVLALVVLLVCAVPASASDVLKDRVTVPRAVDSTCFEELRGGAGRAHRRFTAPATGYLTARLRGGSGDWDVAVFRRSGGEPVAASAFRGSSEVASGYVLRGDRLVVQACRRSGRGRAARVSVGLTEIEMSREKPSLVDVSTPTAAHRRELSRLGFDTTEGSDADSVMVVVQGRKDAARLRRANLRYDVVAPDLVAQSRRDRSADRRYDARVTASALPTGRTTYRRLFDYSNELKSLADANPDLVRPFTLPHKSWGGRDVEGIEITTNPNARDGKPVFLLLGMHHAREWPSNEHAIEWAYELINGYRAAIARTRALVEQTRTIIVPTVNPDGYNFSREAGQANGVGSGRDGNPISTFPSEYHRKNCRPGPSCAVNGGVDPNRNYGDRWGGPGGSTSLTAETYRGPSPFSEPEAQNIRELVAGRQVVTMITLHTFGREILRQPGQSSEPLTADEPLYKALGEDMAAENGYNNIFSYQIGDHVGTTDGWSFYTTSGLGYVFEGDADSFHGPYADTIAEYDGSTVPGGGNREALFVAMESTANPARHSVLTGTAPPGAVLRLTKTFDTQTSLGTIPDSLDSKLEVPASGSFEWHINPSGRPRVPSEIWTLTCERPEGQVQSTQTVQIARGESKALDLTCGVQPPAPPEPPPPEPEPGPEQTTLKVKLSARFNGRFYTAAVTGSLRDASGAPVFRGLYGERCAGSVKVELRAKGRKVQSRTEPVHALCGFEHAFRFKPRALPRSLRKRGARLRLTALARWTGNGELMPARRTVSAQVRRR